MEPPRKRPSGRIKVTLPPREQFMWESPYNLEGKIVVSVANGVGDGATSRVYVGTMNTEKIAAKKLKGYTHSQANSLVKCYEIFQHISRNRKSSYNYF